MTNKVNREEEASHISKLETKLLEDGRIKGNMLTPTVVIIPASLKLLHRNARRALPIPLIKNANIAPRKPTIGAVIVNG